MLVDKDFLFYSIPQNIMKHITFEFCEQMLKELHIMAGVGLSDFSYDSLVFIEGTYCWEEVLLSTCRKLGKDEVIMYYKGLPLYQSEIFDLELSDMMVNYKLLLPVADYDEIARQHGVDVSKICVCHKCGQLFHICNCVIVEHEEDENPIYMCRNCHDGDNLAPMTLDVEKAIKECLGVTPESYFKCEECGKIHYNYNKGLKYCLYCETMGLSTSEHVNQYYIDENAKNKIYLLSVVPERYIYLGYVGYISYDYYEQKFTGTFRVSDNPSSKLAEDIIIESDYYSDLQKEMNNAIIGLGVLAE